MTDAPKTPDHSIPIIGVPLKTDGTLYNDRVGRVHGPMTQEWLYYRDQHGNLFCSHGNYTNYKTHDLDLISEHIPPAKVVRWGVVYTDGSVCIDFMERYEAEEEAEAHSGVEILEMNEVARHPVAPDKGDV